MSGHFLLSEFLASDTARATGIDNFPTWEAVESLKRLAAVMERVRALLGNRPVAISSGFRCYTLNEAVGGVPDSAHLDGLAADFTVPGYGDPLAVCLALEPHLAELEIDQLIAESGWCHLALAADGCIARNECLTLTAGGDYAQGFGV